MIRLALSFLGFATAFCAGCVVQTESVKGEKGDKGEPGGPDLAELAIAQEDIKALKQKIAVLEATMAVQASTATQLQEDVSKLDGAAYCPRLVDRNGTLRRYTPDMSSPGIIRCILGADEMVKVGSFWIDRYEASLVDEAFYTNSAVSPTTPATCDGLGSPFGSAGGAAATDNYPVTFPKNGHWSVPVYACSVAGQIPSQWITWFQAQQACAVAGKRLCRNDEWQAAASGTPDPGASNGANGACVTESTEPRTAGDGAACQSSYGAQDLIGNLQEWVADWSGTPAFDEASGLIPDYWGPDYGDDVVFNVAGAVNDTNIGGYHGRPAAWLRGGSYKLSTGGASVGAFSVSLHNAPSCSFLRVGARCCTGG